MSFECSYCGKLYQRSTHLRRHESTHLGANQFTCPFCSKNFSRRDVCRKHATSCTARDESAGGGSSEIRAVKRGQKSRACDACAQRKLSCDMDRPCSRCVTRQVSCTYIRALEDPSNSRTLDPLRPQQRHEETEKHSVRFLLELTDPKADSMLNTIMKEPLHVSEPDQTVEELLSSYNLPGDTLFQGFLPWSFTQMLVEEFQPGVELFETGSDSDASSLALEGQMTSLISELKDAHEYLTATDPFYDSPFDEDLARTVFTARNAKDFTDSYYQLIHHSFPVTHKPSFELESCQIDLLLALMINGSTRLVPRDDALAVVKFFRLSEAYVLRRLERVAASHIEGSIPSQEVVNTLAAALVTHGTASAFTSNRSEVLISGQQIPFMVATVRHLGLTNIRHAKSLRDTEWSEFIRVESCVRVMNWATFAAFQEASFQNCPPAMAVTELKGDMPCPPELWAARDEAEFRAILQDPHFILPSPSSFSSCFEALMKEKWNGPLMFPRVSPGLLDMLMLVMVIHGAIVSARLMAMLPAMAPGLQRVITRWFEVWDAMILKLGPEKLRLGGLARHSASLAWLARGALEMSLDPGKKCDYMQKIGQATIQELHGLVLACKGK